MSTCILLAATLAMAQTGSLELTNVRATQGGLGAARPDLKIPLGEAIHLNFDVRGLQPDDVRRLRIRTSMEVTDPKGQIAYQTGGVDNVIVDLLGTGQMRHSVHLVTGIEQMPGAYRLKVTVHDLNAKKETSFTKELALLPVEFGLVRFQMTADRDGQVVSPALGVVGQSLYVNAVAVGFKRDPQKEDRGSVSVEMFIADDKDKPLTPKPLTGDAKDIPADVAYVPLRFEVPLQRAGQYKIVIKATDQVSKKMATMTLPLQVVDAK